MSAITQLEQEIIELFVRMADLLNLPRSVGELYGLLFVTEEPLTIDDCMCKLEISKGSVSQGLRILRSFGAVRSVYVPGSRKDHFVAEMQLRTIAKGFVNEQLKPHLDSGQERLKSIRLQLAGDDPAPDYLKDRVEQLQKWEKKAGMLLPLIARVVGA